MIMRKPYIPILKLIIFCSIFVLLAYQFNSLFVPKTPIFKNNYAKVSSFYDLPKESLDVLFFGPSTFNRAFNPLKFWSDFGFTSFSWTSGGQIPQVSYYQLLESLKYHHPEIVVLDSVILVTPFDVDIREGWIRPTINAMRWSPYKLALIHEVVPGSSKHSYTNYIFPLLRYHSRWDKLKKSDFEVNLKSQKSIYKGARGIYYKPNEIIFPSDYMAMNNDIAPLNPISVDYYKRIINLCKEYDIKVVLVNLPRIPWDYAKHNAIQQFADEQQVIFIDYCVFENFTNLHLDTRIDFTDENHLNITGADKLAIDFGKRLVSMGGLQDKRNDPAYDQWNIDANTYITEYQNLMGEIQK